MLDISALDEERRPGDEEQVEDHDAWRHGLRSELAARANEVRKRLADDGCLKQSEAGGGHARG